MKAQVSKIFRSIQVYFPDLQDYRFQFQRRLRNLLNRTHEKDFEALSQLPHSSNNLFLDIGSNRGEAIQSILMRRPDAKIIAFEPNSYLLDNSLFHLSSHSSYCETYQFKQNRRKGCLEVLCSFLRGPYKVFPKLVVWLSFHSFIYNSHTGCDYLPGP